MREQACRMPHHFNTPPVSSASTLAATALNDNILAALDSTFFSVTKHPAHSKSAETRLLSRKAKASRVTTSTQN
ncbi:MAG: hypothetical protein QOJ02_3542 [Acidobacteriota bacterium]|jgi:hypothetical protein|nr:hypothetical protein [Acidobacteriota bacterium]